VIVPVLVVLGGALLPVALFVVGLAAYRAARHPRVDVAPPRDLLILAAHPDDCVVLAGESGIEAARAGRRVEICYFTCGDGTPGSPLARTRREESFAAWSLAGVSPDRFRFLDAVQSDVRADAQQTPEELDRIQRELDAIVRSAPAGAVVILPAGGESHVDHRTIRRLALEAGRRSERPDLVWREAAEYNPVYSLAHSPRRALRLVLESIPLGGRLIGPLALADIRASFAERGPRPFLLPPDAARLELKRKMLRSFHSQDGAKMEGFFGHVDLYRTIDRFPPAGRAEFAGLLRLGDRRLSASMTALLGSLWAGAGTVAGALSFMVLRASARGAGAMAVIASAGAGLLLLALVRPGAPERKLTLAATGLGALLGAILGRFSG
jgi:LmbE family N-acetylglucosaminyl deacetylase